MTETRWGIRTKVRMALAGILVLIVSQIGLTVYYLVEMAESSQVMSDRSQFVSDAEGIRRSARSLVLPEARSVENELRDKFLQTLVGLTSVAKNVSTQFPRYAESMQDVVNTLKISRNAATEWFVVVQQARNASSGKDEMDRLLSGQPDKKGVEFYRHARAFTKHIRLAQQLLDKPIDSAGNDLKREQKYVTQIVDHANRNLISLTMLTLIYLTLMFILLPERLVKPIRSITRVVRQAGLGRLDAEAPVIGGDEIGHLAESFNATIEKLRVFDEKKKDRIVEDSAKINALLSQTPWPTAILTTRFTVEHCNSSFQSLFELTIDDADLPLNQVFENGGNVFRQLLERSLTNKESLSNQTIEIARKNEEPQTFSATLTLCRNRVGRLSHIIVILKQSTTAPSHAS